MTMTSGSDAQPGLRPGYARGRAKRLQIIRAAVDVFAEVGFNGASLREIAASAGISHPGLLHHFPTKSDLLEAVLEYRDEIDIEAFEQDRAAGVSYFEALIRLTDRNAARRSLVELFSAVAAEATSPAHPAHAYFVRRYELVLDGVHKEFEIASAAGNLAAGLDPYRAACTTVALMDGLQIQWLLSLDRPPGEHVDMAGQLRAFLGLLLKEL